MFKQALLYSFFTILSFSIQAQDSPIGLVFGVSGDIGSSRQKLTDDWIQGTDAEFKGLFGYSVGADVGVRIGKFFVLTGAAYSKRGGKTNVTQLWRNYIPEDPNITPDKFPRTETDPVTIQDKLTMNSVRIPLMLGYKFGGDNFEFRIVGGVGYNLFLGKKADFTRDASWQYFTNQNTTETQSDRPSDSDGFGTFEYGSNPNSRFKTSAISIIINPCIFLKLKENSYIKAGLLYENYGNIINNKFRPSGNPLPDGKNNMSAWSFQLGYEYRLNFDDEVF